MIKRIFVHETARPQMRMLIDEWQGKKKLKIKYDMNE